jgi:hypothetical protein
MSGASAEAKNDGALRLLRMRLRGVVLNSLNIGTTLTDQNPQVSEYCNYRLLPISVQVDIGSVRVAFAISPYQLIC